MPNLPISNLPTASVPFTGQELVPIVQGGATVKTTLSALGVVPSTSGGVFFEDPSVTFEYTPPANARFLYIFMCGAGGGGGGGCWGSYPTNPFMAGGGGGSGGLRKEFWFPLNPRPTLIIGAVGMGGAGGAAGDSVGFQGNYGSDGGRTEIVIFYPDSEQVSIYAGQGYGGGGGGLSVEPNGGVSVPAQPYFYSFLGIPLPEKNLGNVYPEYNKTSGGGGHGAPNPLAPYWFGGSVISDYHPSGGGGGGGIDFDNSNEWGRGGQTWAPIVNQVFGGDGSNPSEINGQDGNGPGSGFTWDYSFLVYPDQLPLPCAGGAGGGASSFNYSSGNGGNGYRGSGGGGGGAFSNKTLPDGLAGNGGNGGNGYVIIYEFY